jgi:hypothetical protein
LRLIQECLNAFRQDRVAPSRTMYRRLAPGYTVDSQRTASSALPFVDLSPTMRLPTRAASASSRKSQYTRTWAVARSPPPIQWLAGCCSQRRRSGAVRKGIAAFRAKNWALPIAMDSGGCGPAFPAAWCRNGHAQR